MIRLLAAYFFSFTLLLSIAAPAYMSLTNELYEMAVVDLGEEEENKSEESVKDIEVIIYYSLNTSSLYIGLNKKKSISFYSMNYSSHYQKQTSPPPELIA